MINCSFSFEEPTNYIHAMWTSGICTTIFNFMSIYCILTKVLKHTVCNTNMLLQTPVHMNYFRKMLVCYQIPVSILDFLLAIVFTPVEVFPLPIHYAAGLLKYVDIDVLVSFFPWTLIKLFRHLFTWLWHCIFLDHVLCSLYSTSDTCFSQTMITFVRWGQRSHLKVWIHFSKRWIHFSVVA